MFSSRYGHLEIVEYLIPRCDDIEDENGLGSIYFSFSIDIIRIDCNASGD